MIPILDSNELEQLEILERMLDDVYYYAGEQGLDIFMPDIPTGYDIKRWSDQKVRDYHVVFKLSQFLGLDPLNFEFLDKNVLFPGGYARHHFRDSPRRKLSTNARDVILTDKNKHIEYEKYSEGQMVALLNTLIDVMYAKDASGKFTKEITPKQLYDTLVKHMTPYAKDILPSDAEKRDILLEAKKQAKVFWDIWNDKDTFQATFDPQTGEYKGLSKKFLDNLDDLNRRRDKYLKTGKHGEFLQIEFGLGPNSRRVKNARDFHIILSPNNELGDEMRPTYIDERGYQFMDRVFSTGRGGSVQTRITLFTHLKTQPEIDYVYLLKWYGYLDED